MAQFRHKRIQEDRSPEPHDQNNTFARLLLSALGIPLSKGWRLRIASEMYKDRAARVYSSSSVFCPTLAIW